MAEVEAKVVWEDPPSAGKASRNGVSHYTLAAKLREEPGIWGHILTYPKQPSASSTAAAIRTGRTAAWKPEGDYEAVSRKVDGEYRVYARYVGDE